ncbi:hypothetical protein PM082_003596 [Marasmius tenuissimus]|nr:hypothetical protein PM082_003596 [Marasmius tenuissimus]
MFPREFGVSLKQVQRVDFQTFESFAPGSDFGRSRNGNNDADGKRAEDSNGYPGGTPHWTPDTPELHEHKESIECTLRQAQLARRMAEVGE